MMFGIGSRRATLGGRFGVAIVLACLFMCRLRSCFLVLVWLHLVQENMFEFSCIEQR